jgi:crotonobetainyl-CoA:carnitine CoA-transferase CaiB-like acyl-CoA transferase
MMTQGRIPPRRFGGDFYSICPYGTYRSKEGYIVFAVAEHQWRALVNAMGMPELEHDERYATQEARCSRRSEVRAYIEDWLQTFDDDSEPLRILAEARVPSAPILEIDQVPHHQQIKARTIALSNVYDGSRRAFSGALPWRTQRRNIARNLRLQCRSVR